MNAVLPLLFFGLAIGSGVAQTAPFDRGDRQIPDDFGNGVVHRLVLAPVASPELPGQCETESNAPFFRCAAAIESPLDSPCTLRSQRELVRSPSLPCEQTPDALTATNVLPQNRNGLAPAVLPIPELTVAPPSYLAGALPKDEPQAIYSDDPGDSWNRLFHCLFTRTLKIRLSDDFPEGAPFTFSNANLGGNRKYSGNLFERIESGDRAVEPLYPQEQFRDDVSTVQLLVEPRFSAFRTALSEALTEQRTRPPQERALMQGDLWGAYDFLSREVTAWILKDAPIPLYRERQAELRKPLAQLIKKIALSPDEIKALPDNYRSARSVQSLPDLLAADGEWIEVLWFPDREHDRTAHHRRAARVFLKPKQKPEDKQKFMQRAAGEDIRPQLAAVALLIQNLLVDRSSAVVPSPLTYTVQMRTFSSPDSPGTAPFLEYELSRRALLKDPDTGGLKNSRALPAYLSGAGNDYSFASFATPLAGNPIAVRQAAKCISCHGPAPGQLFTLAGRGNPSAPPIRVLQPSLNEHAHAVAKAKMEKDSFKKLMADWK